MPTAIEMARMFANSNFLPVETGPFRDRIGAAHLQLVIDRARREDSMDEPANWPDVRPYIFGEEE